jgi:peptidoglycan/LPS O-acetylase OafA/YrhL
MVSSSKYAAFKSTRFFGSLNGLRCISIIAVIWHHTASSRFPEGIAHLGYHGVTLFFAISGFLITTLLLREKEKSGTISLFGFYIRRSLRIFPLYYSVLVVYCISTVVFEGSSRYGAAFFENLKFFLTYSSNWFVNLSDSRVIFYFAWSLATEEQFYVLWPSVERFLKGRYAALVAVLMIVVSQAAQYLLMGIGSPAPFPLVVASSISTSICLGVLLAHALNDERIYSVVSKILGRRWSAAAALALCIAILCLVPYLGFADRILVPLSFALLVGSCVIREDNCLAGLLSLKPLDWIGTVSYGVYLLHMLSANLVKRIMSMIGLEEPLVYFVLTSIIAVCAATVSYRFYESRFLRLKDRIEKKRTA